MLPSPPHRPSPVKGRGARINPLSPWERAGVREIEALISLGAALTLTLSRREREPAGSSEGDLAPLSWRLCPSRGREDIPETEAEEVEADQQEHHQHDLGE